MWVHVVIFVMILCAMTGWKKGWIPSSGIGGKDGIRLFAVVAIAGNLLGMILTLQNGGQVYPQGYRLEKEDTGSYEKEFMVSVDGEEPVSMYIQVPEKELEEQEEEPKQNKKLTRKEQAQKSIAEAVSRIPHVAEIQGLSYDEDDKDCITAVKKYQGMEWKIKAALPALVSVCFGSNEPRLATLRSKRAAKNKPLEVYTNADLKMAADEIGLPGSPTMVTDSFQPESTRRAQMLSGTPEELAAKLKELIEIAKGKE